MFLYDVNRFLGLLADADNCHCYNEMFIYITPAYLSKMYNIKDQRQRRQFVTENSVRDMHC